jgi:hypothetical protein
MHIIKREFGVPMVKQAIAVSGDKYYPALLVDVSCVLNELPEDETPPWFSVVVHKKGKMSHEPAPVLYDVDGYITFILDEYTMSEKADILIEVIARTNISTAKSCSWEFSVVESISSDIGEPPSEIDWLDQVFEAASETMVARDEAKVSEENAKDSAINAKSSEDSAKIYSDLASNSYHLFATDIDEDGYLIFLPFNDSSYIIGTIDDSGDLSLVVDMGGDQVA